MNSLILASLMTLGQLVGLPAYGNTNGLVQVQVITVPAPVYHPVFVPVPMPYYPVIPVYRPTPVMVPVPYYPYNVIIWR